MADEAMGIRHVNLLARPSRRVCPNFGNVLIGYHPVKENGEALANFRERHGRQLHGRKERKNKRTPEDQRNSSGGTTERYEKDAIQGNTAQASDTGHQVKTKGLQD
jgi:hypothetical protein